MYIASVDYRSTPNGSFSGSFALKADASASALGFAESTSYIDNGSVPEAPIISKQV
jgi:hypothetical protein